MCLSLANFQAYVLPVSAIYVNLGNLGCFFKCLEDKEKKYKCSQTRLHPGGAGTQPLEIEPVCGIGPHHAMRMDCEQCVSWRGVEKYADC